MGFDTKPNFTNEKFEQFQGDIITLSGCTEIHGILEVENGGVFQLQPDGRFDNSGSTGYEISGTSFLRAGGTVNSIELGNGATTNNALASIAIGCNSIASGATTVSIGNNAQSLCLNSVTIGNQVYAGNNDAVAIGNNSNTTDSALALAIGNGACVFTGATAAISIGNNTKSYSQSNVNIGNSNIVCGTSSIGVGTSICATGICSTAIGQVAKALFNDTLAIGKFACANFVCSISMGIITKTEGIRALSIGVGTQALNSDTIAIGENTCATQVASIGIGSDVNSFGASSIGIGNGITSTGSSTVAMGLNTCALNTFNISMGACVESNGIRTMTIGNCVCNTTQNSVGFGWGNAEIVSPSILFSCSQPSHILGLDDTYPRLGLNVTGATARLHIEATGVTEGFRLVDGNQTDGYVLTSDASGNASWQAMSTQSGLKVFYVDGNNGDVGDGSIFNPFQTIDSALDAVIGTGTADAPEITDATISVAGASYSTNRNLIIRSTNYEFATGAEVNYTGVGYLFDSSVLTTLTTNRTVIDGQGIFTTSTGGIINAKGTTSASVAFQISMTAYQIISEFVNAAPNTTPCIVADGGINAANPNVVLNVTERIFSRTQHVAYVKNKGNFEILEAGLFYTAPSTGSGQPSILFIEDAFIVRVQNAKFLLNYNSSAPANPVNHIQFGLTTLILANITEFFLNNVTFQTGEFKPLPNRVIDIYNLSINNTIFPAADTSFIIKNASFIGDNAQNYFIEYQGPNSSIADVELFNINVNLPNLDVDLITKGNYNVIDDQLRIDNLSASTSNDLLVWNPDGTVGFKTDDVVSGLKVFYVDGNNTNEGDGSILNPFQTIDQAYDVVKGAGNLFNPDFPDVTISIAGADYSTGKNLWLDSVTYDFSSGAQLTYTGTSYLFSTSGVTLPLDRIYQCFVIGNGRFTVNDGGIAYMKGTTTGSDNDGIALDFEGYVIRSNYIDYSNDIAKPVFVAENGGASGINDGRINLRVKMANLTKCYSATQTFFYGFDNGGIRVVGGDYFMSIFNPSSPFNENLRWLRCDDVFRIEITDVNVEHRWGDYIMEFNGKAESVTIEGMTVNGVTSIGSSANPIGALLFNTGFTIQKISTLQAAAHFKINLKYIRGNFQSTGNFVEWSGVSTLTGVEFVNCNFPKPISSNIDLSTDNLINANTIADDYTLGGFTSTIEKLRITNPHSITSIGTLGIDADGKVGIAGGGGGGSSLTGQTITGNNSDTVFTINHGSSTRDILVQVYENQAPYGSVLVAVDRPNGDCITVTFDTAPDNGEDYRVLLLT